MHRLLAATVLVAAALAGCVGTEDSNTPAGDLVPPTNLLAGAAIWNDPQNAPHGGWGWPTLSSPAPEGAPAWWQPINGTALPDAIAGIELLAEGPEDVASGAGIAMFGSILYVPGHGGASYVVDVSDPASPVLMSTLETEHAERGAAMIAYPDGRLVAVVSAGDGFHVQDLTDPWNPVTINYTVAPQGGHKLGVVPGTPIVYNAASCGGSCAMPGAGLLGGPGSLGPQFADGKTEIYDLTDPAHPVLVQEFENGYACHHVYFWNDPANAKYRAICAGIDYTQIWDTADPLNPSVIVSVPVHHGVAGTPSGRVAIVAFSHYAGLSQDGTVLMVGDEMGGGGVPPGCAVSADTPVADPSTPAGAVWFYDVSDETNPLLKGWFSPGVNFANAVGSCTAHHARVVPVEGRDVMAMAFYNQGVVLIDFTDPAMPQMVGHFAEATNTWEVWYNNGYLFTGDLARGTDVLKFV